MDAVASKELEVKVNAVDAPIVMEGLQKIANRITSGVILAALIVGASLLMRVETSWTHLRLSRASRCSASSARRRAACTCC